tara:strand:+ start:8447 stop:9256 length:810 start_codon:yes stop_codon:yes gene_type:complete
MSEIFKIDLKDYQDLLSCNLSGVESSEFKEDLLKEEYEVYLKSLDNWDNYGSTNSLEDWIFKDHHYPVIHPTVKKIIDQVDMLKPSSVCDVGAGAGVVSKFVYNLLKPTVDIYCVEGSPHHLSQMKENFSESSTVIAPQLEVKANIVQGIAQNIPLEDNKVELSYTCTVMMHIPFLMIPAVAKEMARITSGYIVHSENDNTVVNTVAIGRQKSQLNYLQIDYPALYNKLGVKTVTYKEAEEYNQHCKSGKSMTRLMEAESALLFVGKKN